MKISLFKKTKKKVKRREQKSFTAGASQSEPTLQRNVRPEDSPISPTAGLREASTPETEPRSQNIPRGVFFTTPGHPSQLQKKGPRQERPVVQIKAKDFSLKFDEKKLNHLSRKWGE
ncbi:hypothetical protein O181_085099 [Austropuccinia psidii MF-1]|uniref:Uncharacterized protein n=1 Tax=Austropuccinia psidii MF-1 TaxID=1389203 RepID=A0A9Q3FUC8_9BASI|nr:hypothetical protein [Austropuccinia psidii MF-1]